MLGSLETVIVNSHDGLSVSLSTPRGDCPAFFKSAKTLNETINRHFIMTKKCIICVMPEKLTTQKFIYIWQLQIQASLGIQFAISKVDVE